MTPLVAEPPAESRPAQPAAESSRPAATSPPPPSYEDIAAAYDRELLALSSPDSPEPLTPRPLSRYGVSMRFAAGASYQRLYTVNITSAQFELGLGGRVGNQAGYLNVAFEPGVSEFGLRTSSWHLGALGEWCSGRFRYGVQARTGMMFVRRASENDDLESFSVGIGAQLAVDFVRFDGGDALFLELAARADYYVPLVYGPSLLLGYRFQSNHRFGGSRR